MSLCRIAIRPVGPCQPCNRLLSPLMKGHPDLQGILYCAIGEGEGDWDALCPSPRLDSSRLAKEVAGQALSPEQIIYLDDADQESDVPTNCLEITAEFRGEDLVSNGLQSLREFGLFASDATEAPDSGFMIDYVIHPRIDLTPEDTLKRKLRLAFMSGFMEPKEALGFGADLPVAGIAGVGDAYAGQLHAQGIHTLSGLAALNPARPVENIPPGKLREFQAKARMVIRLRGSPTPLAVLTDYPLARFLQERPTLVARASRSPAVTPKRVQHLQEALAQLQIALDDAQLQRLKLGDLMNV